MRCSPWKAFRKYALPVCLSAWCGVAMAQTTPASGTTGLNTPKQDSAMNKTNTTKWKDEEALITYQQLNSARVYTPDTALHTFQRNPFTQPWYQDLGNLGSPVNNLLFTPEDRLGPTLGYHVFDVYRFNVDSLNYYSTTRPYSVFSYNLGSKLEQYAGIMHTQNIRPNWNVMVDYRKTNSPGFYMTERNNNDNASFSTNYKSLDKHYVLYAAMVYNKEQHDENGGIVDAGFLSDPAYSDRRTINTVYENTEYSSTRSPVSNVQRDFSFLLQHTYRWGNIDTTYNSDSTQYTYRIIPRFSITHKMEMSTEKHTYTDLAPDSLQYVSLFHQTFTSNGTGYYTLGQDSVLTQQKWFWVDNKILLNGFIGKEGRQLEFSAGLGNRYDEFISTPVSNIIKDSLPKLYYSSGLDRSSIVSNYLVAEIKKEALQAGAWEYNLNTKFFLTGQHAGNFLLNASVGKQLKNILGSFVAGFQQQVGSAPYSYTNYENLYTKDFFSFNNESVTTLYATIESPRFRLSFGARNYVMSDYIYINDSERPAQYTIPFSISQVWIRKVFKAGNFFLDNELVYQQLPGNAPVNVPAVMGRHQLSYERSLFKRSLKMAIGIEVRYNSSYNPSGYDPILNKFYYQNSTYVLNAPVGSVFFNFRIKRFRAFVMGDNLQQLFTRNAVLYTAGPPLNNYNNTGYNYNPVYAAPDALIRFGFNWVLVN